MEAVPMLLFVLSMMSGHLLDMAVALSPEGMLRLNGPSMDGLDGY